MLVRIAVALLLTVVAGAPARSQDEGSKFIYAVPDAQASVVGVVGDDHNTPAGPVALASSVSVVPAGTSLAIHIDDFALPDGNLVSLRVNTGGRWIFEACVPVRSETTVRGTRLGQPANVSVGLIYGNTCGLPATAGVLTVRGLR